eukprot:GHVP01023651.1.p1 GENE.GHVP01023651.1~~GHVP01023651.1.p1  ORF type:complete len:174 (+),score=52.96 GHVP01023651.1:963-1484(+)
MQTSKKVDKVITEREEEDTRINEELMDALRSVDFMSPKGETFTKEQWAERTETPSRKRREKRGTRKEFDDFIGSLGLTLRTIRGTKSINDEAETDGDELLRKDNMERACYEAAAKMSFSDDDENEEGENEEEEEDDDDCYEGNQWRDKHGVKLKRQSTPVPKEFLMRGEDEEE